MNGFLGIYLRDQLALGVAWRELARRAAGNNKGTEAGTALARVAAAIAEDVATFEKIMDRLNIRPDRMKNLAVTVAERIGRFKPNGRLLSYSPLSRFEEIEFLIMGIEGKKQLWSTLRDLAGLGARLPDVDFDELVERAAAQRAQLEPYRTDAGLEAFVTASPDA
jgi:hypothetical protein